MGPTHGRHREPPARLVKRKPRLPMHLNSTSIKEESRVCYFNRQNHELIPTESPFAVEEVDDPFGEVASCDHGIHSLDRPQLIDSTSISKAIYPTKTVNIKVPVSRQMTNKLTRRVGVDKIRKRPAEAPELLPGKPSKLRKVESYRHEK
jgi:hypothetical protein